MTDPNQPAPNTGPDGANEPADAVAPAAGDPAAAAPDAPTAPTEPIAAPVAPGAVVPPPVPVPQAPAAPGLQVKRSWLVAGAGVGAVGLLGLGFGLGYITGDQTGGHGERMSQHERGEMRGFTGEMPGGRFGGEHRWLVVPPNGQDGQAPNQQQPQTPTPAPSTPGTSS
ncbi:hypothetical protein [Gordonia phthalatica]|uniref:Uncharacterized protein n=1 Tax=Gordonia phthalatica TaxID=1136941 RepID=A0A0N7FU74_9ACTN|nr:hypothetical protein [Gordonia phthalatica]ALG83567.1 hypothetical protein ACH46_02390 [Gordonia phthalatica]